MAERGIPCLRGDQCPLAHSKFEQDFHPATFRTQMCRRSPGCNDPLCPMAHTAAQLRQRQPEDPRLLTKGLEFLREVRQHFPELGADQGNGIPAAGAGAAASSNIDAINAEKPWKRREMAKAAKDAKAGSKSQPQQQQPPGITGNGRPMMT